MPVDCASDARTLLGEGPLWDADREVLWWVDIKAGSLLRFDPQARVTMPTALPSRVTALGLARDGRLLTAGDAGFAFFTPENGAVELLARLDDEPAGNRSNDGKVDEAGRFWVGTMDDAEREASGGLYCLEPGGAVQRLADGMHVPNGPAFDAQGTMYLADSAIGTIYRYPPGASGRINARETFATFSERQGFPDGMCCDAAGYLWVAFWDGWCVRRLAPDGSIDAEIAMPVQRPTSCCFGGRDLRRLYVTSARVGIDDAALANQPLAGGLFAIELAIEGRPSPYFGPL